MFNTLNLLVFRPLVFCPRRSHFLAGGVRGAAPSGVHARQPSRQRHGHLRGSLRDGLGKPARRGGGGRPSARAVHQVKKPEIV